MRGAFVPGMLWFSAIGCGVMSGVYFAFSTFIMASFARLAPDAGIAAMNAINLQIVRSPFMPLFLATTLVAVGLAGYALFHWSAPWGWAALAGGTLYVFGMFGVTMAFNVPLNDALAAHPFSGGGDAEIWARYLRDWTFWNHVRTLASLGASILFVVSLRAID